MTPRALAAGVLAGTAAAMLLAIVVSEQMAKRPLWAYQADPPKVDLSDARRQWAADFAADLRDQGLVIAERVR
jgi:hypothetical protein